MFFTEDLILKVSNMHSRAIQSFCDHLSCFQINHFWLYKISNDGFFSFLGSHNQWNDLQFEQKTHLKNPYIRHPSVLQNGISLMAEVEDLDFRDQCSLARNKFDVNFNINLSYPTQEGIEGFGVATPFLTSQVTCTLLNELPMLKLFLKQFKSQYPKIFQQLDEHSVDMAKVVGPAFYTPKGSIVHTLPEKKVFLTKIGIQDKHLSAQEIKVLGKITDGYCSREIAEDLSLSKRTVEHYIDNIKNKFGCHTKRELIQKIKESYI
jgi:DNA-binding CsgD family transcriptional regulator